MMFLSRRWLAFCLLVALMLVSTSLFASLTASFASPTGRRHRRFQEELRKGKKAASRALQSKRDEPEDFQFADAPAQLRKLAMLDTDAALPASIGVAFVDMSQGTASQCSTYSSNVASQAIDGSTSTSSLTSKQQWSYWQWETDTRLKVTGVELVLRQQGGSYQNSLDISIDGRTCGVLHRVTPNARTFVPCYAPLFGKTLRIQDSSGASTHLQLYEVRIQEEPSGRYEATKDEVRATICPWASTMLNMKKLRGCRQTKETLLEVALASGLPEHLARRHIDQNFVNIPSGEQDICDMEGALNEHKNSTRVNDCLSFIAKCDPRHGGNPAVCEVRTTENKACGNPNAGEFEEFWVKIKNGDTSPFLTTAELVKNAHLVPVTDDNPVGEGTIDGSFSLLLAVFGFNVSFDGDTIHATIHKDNLAEVLLQRVFPSNGYKYGVPRS